MVVSQTQGGDRTRVGDRAALESRCAPKTVSARGRNGSCRTVMVVDDHPIARAGVICLLNSHNWLEVVGQAADGQEAITKAKALSPDLIVVDINLPKVSGLAVTKNLRAELPHSRVVILSMHSFEQVAVPVIESGARGYVCKRVATEELVEALERVASGGVYFPPVASSNHSANACSGEERHQARGISPRERQVLVGIAEGLSNKQVADQLGLGVRTVETHRGALMRKLNIHNVAGLTRFALQNGIVPAASV